MQSPPGYPPQQPPGYPPQQQPGYPPQQQPGYPPQQQGQWPPQHQPPQQKKRSPVFVVLIVLGLLSALGIGGCIVCVVLLPDVEPSAAGDGTKHKKAALEDYFGTWTAKGIVFRMTKGKGLDGKESISVHYEKDASTAGVGTSVEKSGRFKELDGNDVVVGVAFMTTTIEVDEPPHAEGGVWKMTVEGDVLTRQTARSSSAAPPSPSASADSADSKASARPSSSASPK